MGRTRAGLAAAATVAAVRGAVTGVTVTAVGAGAVVRPALRGAVAAPEAAGADASARAQAGLDPELADHAVDLLDLIGRDQRDRDALGAGAAGAAGAVHVGLGVVWRVELEDVRDPGDVDAAGGHIGGYQGVDVEGLEVGQCALALALALVSVHRHGRDALTLELLDELVGAVLGAHEHEREVARRVQVADQRVQPRLVGDRHEAMLDIGGGGALGRAAFVEGGGVRVAACGMAGVALERRREEHRLTVGRAERDDAVQRGLEAHVEHPVGLVDHEHPYVLEREGAA